MPAGFFHTLSVVGVLMMEGTTQAGERVLIITAEQPDRVPGFDGEVPKDVLERYHLESFRADHVLAFGQAPWDRVQRGDDPPDFLVTTADGREGVDCAAFADHDRRLGFALMDHLRRRLIDGAGERDFDGVAGCVLSVWFGAALRDLPPKRWDDSIIEPLLDEISACQVDHQAVARLTAEIAERGFPEVMPPVVATGSIGSDAAGFVANVLLGPTDGLRFSTGLGFEVQLARSAEVTASGAISTLLRLVTTHDQPAIRHLVLTAGGPDRRGTRYPGEEAIASFLLSLPNIEIQANHLVSVAVHLWAARRIHYLPVKATSSPGDG